MNEVPRREGISMDMLSESTCAACRTRSALRGAKSALHSQRTLIDEAAVRRALGLQGGFHAKA
jgi:hypothetical protein